MEMDYTDSYGSYTRLITTRHPATGYMEEEMEMAAYDEFGLLTESRSEERSTDPADSPVETDLWVKGSVDYTAAGLLQCYTRSAQVEGSDSFAPVMRQLFDGYDPTAGIAAPGADEAAPGAKGIYTSTGAPARWCSARFWILYHRRREDPREMNRQPTVSYPYLTHR